MAKCSKKKKAGLPFYVERKRSVQRSRNHQSGIPPVITRLLFLLFHYTVSGSNRARGGSGTVDLDPRMNARLSRNETVIPVSRRVSLPGKLAEPPGWSILLCGKGRKSKERGNDEVTYARGIRAIALRVRRTVSLLEGAEDQTNRSWVKGERSPIEYYRGSWLGTRRRKPPRRRAFSQPSRALSSLQPAQRPRTGCNLLNPRGLKWRARRLLIDVDSGGNPINDRLLPVGVLTLILHRSNVQGLEHPLHMPARLHRN